jgi:predicted HicB family RNase H-like nuclease
MAETSPVSEETPRKPFTVRFPPEMHRLLAHLAVDRGLSLGDLMVRVMAEWAEKQPETARYGTVSLPKPSKRGPKTTSGE